MLGWMILFALVVVLVVVLGFVATVRGNSVPPSMWITSIVFACLFLVGLLTRAVRGRAW